MVFHHFPMVFPWFSQLFPWVVAVEPSSPKVAVLAPEPSRLSERKKLRVVGPAEEWGIHRPKWDLLGSSYGIYRYLQGIYPPVI
jgi:hypothetical protein